MDENLQQAESVQQPITGEELYSKYASGESIENLNDSLNSSANTDFIDSETEIKENENLTPEQDDSGNPASGEETIEVKPYRTYASQEDFQRDVDKMIGKRLYEAKSNTDKLKEQMAEFLGISKDDVEKHLSQLKYQKEAENNGAIDPELYAQNKILEQKLNEFNSQQKMNEFMNDVDRQVNQIKDKYPSFDMQKCCDNPAFCRMLKLMHDDPQTTNNAVELAYKSFYFDDVAKDIAKSETDKVLASIKAGTTRVSEGAVNTNPPANTTIDPSRLTSKQFDDIMQRVKNGEKVILG